MFWCGIWRSFKRRDCPRKGSRLQIQGKLDCMKFAAHIIRWRLILVNFKVNSDLKSQTLLPNSMKWAFYSVMLYNRCSNPAIGTGVWPSGKEFICNAGDAGLTPGSGRSPGRGHGTHSSVLAWRIPWTEEPGGLQSIRSHRVRQD